MKKIIALMLAVVMLLGNVPVALAQSGEGNTWQTPIPSVLNIDQDYIQANSEKLFSGENVIEDPVIREAINAAYRREGDKVNLPVTAEMLKHVVTLSPEKCLPHNPGEDAHKCKSLKGMEYATNLEYVSLPYQPIEDLSPLKDLTNLKYLNITGNDKVKDFSFFNNLVNLEEIHIRMVKVKDISAFANYKNLRYLDADSCEISDFSPLSELTKLTFLNLDKNIFAENSAEAFAKLVNLEFLNINNKAPNYGLGFFPKKINDIAPLSGLTKLKEFHATGHAIEDISILKNMPNLTTVFLNNNNIADFSPVDHVKNVNGKTDQVILTESEKFKPVLKAVDVPVGTTVTADMLKAGIDNLPADATLSLVNGMVVADTSKEGTTKQQAKITFKDDSRKFVTLTINVVAKQEEKPHEPLQVMLMKDDVPLQENVTFEILDGDTVVEKVELVNGEGEVKNCKVGKTYTVRVTNPDKYEAETTFMKVVEEEGLAGAHFLKSEVEATSFENAAFLRVKEKTPQVLPKERVMASLAEGNQPVTTPVSIEVLDKDEVVETIDFIQGMGFATDYEFDKVYTLRIKGDSNYELVTKYMTVVSHDGSAAAHFLKTADGAATDANAIHLYVKAKSSDTPQVSEGLDQLAIKVQIYGEPKAGILLRINHFDSRGIPGIVNQPKTDANGSYVLKDLQPNSKYTVVIPSSEYNFDENTFDVLTDKDSKIVSVAGHPASEYKDGMIIKGVNKSDTSLDNVDLELKVVDKKTGKPQEGVEVTANKIFPLQSFRNVKSDKNGVVHFKLTGSEEGLDYALTVSKNDQFFWEFEPEVINVKVYKNHFKVLKTDKNPYVDDTLRVTYNNRTHLRNDLQELVDKAQGILDSGKYTDASVKDLKTAVQGGVAELAKAETIPYYVEGHIDNIKKAMKKLVLKEESKPNPSDPTPNPSKPDPKPNPNPSTPKDEGRYYFIPYVPAASEKKASVVAKNKLYVPYRNLPVTLTDIPAKEKGDAIRAMVTRGILVGMGNDKFEPKTTISRAMVTAVFMRISMDQTIKSPAAFTDVKDKAWYERSVKWASTNGLIKGYEDGSFKPDKKVSYEEFAVMLDNLLKEYKLDLPKVKTVNKADFDYVNDWSRDSVVRMIELGLMKTDGNGKVQPKGEYSRADLAETLNQLIQWSDKNK